jgi:hypothetical protein
VGLRSWFRRRFRPDATDAWAPDLGVGEWRTVYGECCDAVLAYNRVVATMDAGPLQDRLRDLGMQLPPLLLVAKRLGEVAERISPHGHRRSADFAPGAELTPASEVMDHLCGLRDALAGLADDAARVAVRLRENPAATDVRAILSSLGAGLADARRHGWTPIGDRADLPGEGLR